MSNSSSIPIRPTLAPQPPPGEASKELQVPQFGGSPVGFWVLVVSLALIVIICCIAIFWLLKTHEPTSAERARRKAKREVEKSSAEIVSTSEGSNPRGLKERIGRFFGRGGWTKPNDDIEVQKAFPGDPDWKTEVDKEDIDSSYFPTTRLGYGGVPSDLHHEYHRDTRMSSTSTVQLSAPSSEHTPIVSRGVDLPFEPPYRSESPQQDINSPPSEDSFVDEGSHQGERDFSVISGDHAVPMRKFRNGTRFMEQI